MKKEYDQWKKEVDAFVEARLGIDTECLPDMPYRRWYDEGLSPARVAQKAIAKARQY